MTASTTTTTMMTSSMATFNSSCTQTHFNQFMIVTPVVLIDRNYTRSASDDQYSSSVQPMECNHNYENAISCTENNMNAIHRYVNNCSNSTATNLLPTSTSTASWRWCTLICAAIRCFGENNISRKRHGCHFSCKSHDPINTNVAYEL